ncbi:hypothetical protein KAR91_65575 [Candidatus Pacearchaeota archaeon]|nr:hypothetical protein [Candidatus Pacearchaeota archaeon]
MTKRTADKWLYKIYKMLNTISMQFRLNRKLVDHGLTMVYDNNPKLGAFMVVDPEKKEFMGTIIHECLHLVDWEMSETKVAKLERSLMYKLTDRQLMNLLKRIVMYHTKRTKIT